MGQSDAPRLVANSWSRDVYGHVVRNAGGFDNEGSVIAIDLGVSMTTLPWLTGKVSDLTAVHALY